MGKIVLIVVITLVLANSLALVGLLGYGLATGRLDSDQRAQYLATWQGEKLVPPPPEEAPVEEKETPQQASARIAEAELERETIARETQRDIELARYMQSTIAEAKRKIGKDLKQLRADQATFQSELDRYNDVVQSEGFQKALKNYSRMKAKVVKTDFMEMPDEAVVRYLAQMKSDTATKILEQFKTSEEQQKRLRLMQLLERHRVISMNQKR